MKHLLLAGSLLAASLAAIAGAQAQRSAGVPVRAPGNPILVDGNYYSADPAPFVFDEKLWILAGRDEAPADVNDFIMNEWQLLATETPEAGAWTHFPAVVRPEEVFKWATPGRAYAGHMVKGSDGRVYFYAPVHQANTTAKDKFSIGVAVADSPLGPWVDAHPEGPIVSQQVPEPNEIQNIDPTVLVDDDGRVYLYWGTFGQLRGVELEKDMVTPKGEVIKVDSLTGFFEAPWLMKRNGIYYMLYAGNQAGPESDCTPALYHACIAYGTASSPLGPWTYRGVLLKPVSSTTSHPGAVEFGGRWYLAYHTADAKSGGHFRRSVAIDRLEFDDTQSPPAIRLVTPTRRLQPTPVPTRNIAAAATAAASNEPIPVRYWIKALNDGITKPAPLPPDMWGSAMPNNPAQQWLEYRWDRDVTINGARIWLWADQPAGADTGTAPPKAWQLFYWDAGWKPLGAAGDYGTEPGQFQAIAFPPITTRCLRAVLTASGKNGAYAGLAVQEWEVLAPKARVPQPPGAHAAPPCE